MYRDYDSWKLAYPDRYDAEARDPDPIEDDDDEDDSDPERTPIMPPGPTTDRIQRSDVMAALLEAERECFREDQSCGD